MVGCKVGEGLFPSVGIMMLSQPSLAGVETGAELGKYSDNICVEKGDTWYLTICIAGMYLQ